MCMEVEKSSTETKISRGKFDKGQDIYIVSK